MILWDEARQIFTDPMGYPLSRSSVEALRGHVRKHLKHSPADLAAVAVVVTKERYPTMTTQLDFSPELYI